MAANRNDIPVGRNHAISRAQLAALWNMNDRAVRRIVAEMRSEAAADGYVILSTSRSPSGYWRSNSPDEIRAFIRETEARGRGTFLALRNARIVLKELQNNAQYPINLLDEGA